MAQQPQDMAHRAEGPSVGPGGGRLLTLHEAAEHLNVHYMTAYRWVRRGELPAFKTGGRLRVRASDVDRFLAARRVDVAVDTDAATDTDWDRHVDRLTQTLLGGDATSARNEVRSVISDGATAGNAYVRLITPSLHRVGHAWERGDINVAVEHRAHQICVAIVSQLGDMFRRHGPARGIAITVTPPGEQHDLASAMVSDFLRAAGYMVHHLGGDVPITDLQMFINVVPADLVCFSVTQAMVAEDYVALVTACREVEPGTDVVFGGQGVDSDAVANAGAIAITDLADLMDHVSVG
ncbi:MAG TPA: helix-turn-helix domain-containing protein [Euzebyales bacterium]